MIIYVHSDQQMVYRAKADKNGNWTVDHSQATLELAPGTHTIFAVAVDQANKVKSRPSAIKQFTVEKNFWVNLFSRLNLSTTLFTLIIAGAAAGWLYLRRRKAVVI